jgi:hypothetical protein
MVPVDRQILAQERGGGGGGRLVAHEAQINGSVMARVWAGGGCGRCRPVISGPVRQRAKPTQCTERDQRPEDEPGDEAQDAPPLWWRREIGRLEPIQRAVVRGSAWHS